jgi:sec-independent protein translocase protein TatB
MGITPPIEVATISMGDSLLLMVIALVVLGPRRLPQVGRQIGKLMYEFRKASNDFKFQMEEELRNAEEADRRKREEAERQRTLAETQSAVAQAQSAAQQALSAAAQAQNAAQAALNAADSQHDNPSPDAVEAAAEPVASGDPDMIYTFGSSEEETANATEKVLESSAMQAEPEPTSVNGSTISAPGNGSISETGSETGSEIKAEPAATGLRVQPPSTGEQVPAARPRRTRSAVKAAKPDVDAPPSADAGDLKNEVAAEKHSAAAESAANHG